MPDRVFNALRVAISHRQSFNVRSGDAVPVTLVDRLEPALHDLDMSKRQSVLLATVGYEGVALDEFIVALQEAGIKRLLDIRELPLSRRKGFSKNAIATALSAGGIEYVHLRGLGDPKPGRQAARSGDFALFRRIFVSHMHTPKAQVDLAVANHLVAGGGTCLMCYEREHANCHRSIVAEAIATTVPVKIRHLRVSSASSQPTARRATSVEFV
jgi:uncharacterized protein (DUF488 family)